MQARVATLLGMTHPPLNTILDHLRGIDDPFDRYRAARSLTDGDARAQAKTIAREAIAQLRADGWTTTAIAHHLGITRQAVSQLLPHTAHAKNP